MMSFLSQDDRGRRGEEGKDVGILEINSL